jgi:hypothetical protein
MLCQAAVLRQAATASPPGFVTGEQRRFENVLGKQRSGLMTQAIPRTTPLGNDRFARWPLYSGLLWSQPVALYSIAHKGCGHVDNAEKAFAHMPTATANDKHDD